MSDMSKPLIDPEAQSMTQPTTTKPSKASNKEQRDMQALYQSATRSVLLTSASTGFAVQLISLAAYTYMLVRWGTTAAPGAIANADMVERNLYMLLQCLSQADLCVYSVIWVGFTVSLTTRGVRFVMSHVYDDNDIPAVSSEMRRFVFLLGVNCLVGLVLGAFVSWTLIDMVLGFAVPYSRIVQTVAIDLALCYAMLLCYDCGGVRPSDDDEDEE